MMSWIREPLKLAAIAIAFIGLLAFALFSVGAAPGLFWVIVRWVYQDELGPIFAKTTFARQSLRAAAMAVVLTVVTFAFANVGWMVKGASFFTEACIGLPLVMPGTFLWVPKTALIYFCACLVLLLGFAPRSKPESAAVQGVSQ